MRIFQAGNPHIGGLQSLDFLRQIGNLRHEKMLDRARRRIDGGRGNARRAPFLDDDPVDTDGLGSAQQTSQVVDILDQIEQQE